MDKPFKKIGFVDCLALLLIYFTAAGSSDTTLFSEHTSLFLYLLKLI